MERRKKGGAVSGRGGGRRKIGREGCSFEKVFVQLVRRILKARRGERRRKEGRRAREMNRKEAGIVRENYENRVEDYYEVDR